MRFGRDDSGLIDYAPPAICGGRYSLHRVAVDCLLPGGQQATVCHIAINEPPPSSRIPYSRNCEVYALPR